MKFFDPAFPTPVLIEHAIYKDHPDEWLNQNPLIRAIQVKDWNQLNNEIPFVPELPENIHELSKVYQKTVLRRLSCINVLHPWSIELYEDIMSSILFGYVNRDPRKPELARFQRELSELSKGKNKDAIYEKLIVAPLSPLTSTNNAVVTGPSGSGKTTTIRRTLLAIPQVIIHPEFDNTPQRLTQIVWLSFDMPASDSPKGLALAFFRAIDMAIGTNYYKDWKGRKSESIEHHYAAIQLLILEYNIGFIHIDEMQFMLKFGSGRNSITLQAIEALFNKLSVPTMISCTPEGLKLFDAQPALSSPELDTITTTRRVYSDQIYVFELAPVDSELFENLFSAFFPQPLSRNPEGFSTSFKIKVATLTAGLLAVITRLAQLYHRISLSIDDMDEEDLLEAVFIEQFGPLSEALKRLGETGNEKLLESLLVRDDSNNCIWVAEESESAPKQRREEVPDLSNEHKRQ
ncbi:MULTISPECIES: ATP-binding protein [unclassified Pseudoalteromonas]|uniref:ATP-binding protein n=1 Tax=unclassified Pseudoalteromonas TaxID=194690 RepID=UPI000CF61672|nr:MULTISPECIES: ATP-binding protein [unclassified Pseudoalteromonas]MCO7250090.1 ATP-binding protein [Pseudoalteromonas sp. Ps84H-4]